MKSKLRAVTAAVLAVCSAAVLFTACGEKSDNIQPSSTASSVAETTTINTAAKEQTLPFTKAEILSQNEYYTYYKPATDKATIAYTYVQHTLNNFETQANSQNEKPTQNAPASNEEISEIKNGVSIVTKTTPVVVGNSATVMIQGTPGKKYSLDFYETSSKTAAYDGLENKTADSNGFVTWSFEIKNTCPVGNKKIIIKELGSDKFIQTSITVQ